MKLISLCLFIAFSCSAFGQPSYSYGFNFAAGVSRVPMNGENITFSTKIGPSGVAGLFFQTKLKKRGLLGVEVNLSQIEGRWTSEEQINDGFGNTIGTRFISGKQHITYISLPIFYGFTLKNCTLYGGVQFGLAASGKRANSITTIISGDENTSEELGNLSIVLPDFGTRIGAIWKISNKISLEAKYYQGLLNIFDQETTKSTYFWLTQQATLGVRIALRNTNDCGTCPAWN